MRIRYKILKTLMAFIFLSILFYGCTNIKMENEIEYENLNVTLQDILIGEDIDNDNLKIIDFQSDGFTIWIDKTGDEVIEIMLDMAQVDEHGNSNGKIISLNYTSKDSVFTKTEGIYDISDDWRTHDRISVKDYLLFLENLDYSTILSDYQNPNIDYYEIRTDGLYRIVKYPDYSFNYTCYVYQDNSFTKLDSKMIEKMTGDEYYLPIYLSTGTIHNQEEYDIYNNEISVVILFKSQQ